MNRVDIPILASIQTHILNPIIGLLFALALVAFLLGVVESFRKGNSTEIKTKGKEHMIWGVVGMAIMVSVFGILKILSDTINSLS